MENIVIFGAGDFAKIAYLNFVKQKKYNVVAFTLDKAYIEKESFLGLPIIDFSIIQKNYSPSQIKMFIAVGYTRMNKLRADKFYEAKKKGYELVNFISDECTFLTDEKIGENTFIFEDNTIQPFVKIGSNVIIWSGNHIGHDSTINDHCFISSHVVISGRVEVESYCFFGVNSSICNSVMVSKETFVGPGTVISKNTVEKGVYLLTGTKLSSKKSDEIVL